MFDRLNDPRDGGYHLREGKAWMRTFENDLPLEDHKIETNIPSLLRNLQNCIFRVGIVYPNN